MDTPKSLAALAATANAYEGSWKNARLAQDIKMFLWESYDSNDDLIYPTINNWNDLLTDAIRLNSYDILTRDDVLSVLFGLIHRDRIVDGTWWSMFERGITQKLLERLLAISEYKS